MNFPPLDVPPQGTRTMFVLVSGCFTGQNDFKAQAWGRTITTALLRLMIFQLAFGACLSSHTAVGGHGLLSPFGRCEWSCVNVGVQGPV